MATSQTRQSVVSGPPRGAMQLLVAAAVLALMLALAAAIPGSRPDVGIAATAGERAAADALVQVRRDERQERYAPTVDEIRRALVDLRTSEREER